MRKYTLVFSIVAHAVAVGTIIVPALATEELPEPRRTSEFIIVKPEMPAPPVVRPQSVKVAPSTAIPVPLSPPEGIQPEPIVEPRDPGALDFGASPTGVPGGDFVSGGEPVPPPPPPIPSRPKEPVHVGGRIEAPTKLVHVNPIYPPIPLAARKEGLVILEALIAEDGTVRDVKVLRRAPLFEESAIAAVRQWRFSPTLLNGEPVPIVMTVTVGFTLGR
jgi:protein TonB